MTDLSPIFNAKINVCIKKCTQNAVINKDWENFLKSINPIAGKMHSQVKIHKNNNPLWIITSGYNTGVESLSVFVEKLFYPLADKLPPKRDTGYKLDIFDDINSLNIQN